MLSLLHKYREFCIVFVVSFVIAIFLMWLTFYVNDGVLFTSYHLWQDFWFHISLIRSFSVGNNWPPEYPFFPGEPIRYHFLFYLLVAILEKAGLHLVTAFNVLGSLGFATLLSCLYFFAKHLFRFRLVGWLSILFFLFHSSFSWIYYLFDKARFPSLLHIIEKGEYASIGPYDGRVVSIFWNLNPYLNQRHFVFALALFFIIYFLLVVNKTHKALGLGILLIVVLSWTHKVVWVMSLMLIGLMSIKDAKINKKLFGGFLFSLLFSLPALSVLSSNAQAEITFSPGFLYKRVDWSKFLDIEHPILQWCMYWLMNWGVMPFLALAGWITLLKLSIKKQTRSFLFSAQNLWFIFAILLFVVCNIFSLSSDLVNNHKLLNLTQIIWSCFAGFFIWILWQKKVTRFFVPLLILFMTLGGMLDFFPTVFAQKAQWPDLGNNSISQHIVKTVPGDGVILNTTYFTEPINITGRKIFFGFDIFAWSVGYRIEERKELLKPLLLGQLSDQQVCEFSQNHNIYLIYLDHIDPQEEFAGVRVNHAYFDQLFPDFQHAVGENVLLIYVKNACDQLPVEATTL